MEITYKSKTIRFTDKGAKLPVILQNKVFMVPWGRRDNEHGALPAMPYIGDTLIKAGMFQGFKQQHVPILADEYRTEDDRGYLVPDVVQPGQYMQGLLLDMNNEKRVYIVGLMFKSSDGFYITPKMIWRR